MRICVLQPDQAADRETLADLAALLPQEQVDVVLLSKATIYRQLKSLKKQGYDIFVNLCRNYLDSDYAAYSEVTRALVDLNLPHTGSALSVYDAPKSMMKSIAFFAGVETAGFVVAETIAQIEQAATELSFPLFVKPLALADGLGIDGRSLVTTYAELVATATEVMATFDAALIEEFVAGREFSVLVVANPEDVCAPLVYSPVEAVFSGVPFKTAKPESVRYIPCDNHELSDQLRDAAKRVFVEINQGGYACVDFRLDAEGEPLLIDINSPCAVFAANENTLADIILQHDAAGRVGFLNQIIAEGIGRHRDRQKKYCMQKSPIATYGIFATQAFAAGDVIVAREATLQSIATLNHVRSHWSAAKQDAFLRYTYVLDEGVMVLRDPNPDQWLVQNHSCNPNTVYRGFDLVATRDIAAGDELTVDFATFRDQNQLEFDCLCGAPNCRGLVRLQPCCEPELRVNLSDSLLVAH